MNFKFVSRLLAIPVLAVGFALGQSAPAWANLTVTLSSLVPAATVSLNPPVTCSNGVTVYDAGDLGLCVDPSLILPLTDPPTCPQMVGPGFVRLQADITCADATAFVVIADNTIIDLNGHTVSCTAPGDGYQGTCQEADADDAGVDTNGHNNVHVFSNLPGGTLKNFDKGVWIHNGSSNVKVKQLNIVGPASPGPGANPRPASQGVAIDMANSPLCMGNIHIGGGVSTGNEIHNFTEGVDLTDANCVEIGHNFIHDNNSDPIPCHGIHAENSAHNNFHSNNVTKNGENLAIDGGITLDGSLTTDTIVTDNLVGTSAADHNNGDGISARNGAGGNMIVNDVMKFNGTGATFFVFFDAASGAARGNTALNQWTNLNCITQTTPEPPPGTCTATS